LYRQFRRIRAKLSGDMIIDLTNQPLRVYGPIPPPLIMYFFSLTLMTICNIINAGFVGNK
ncbi:MAG: hypothetical protein CVU43_24875, partial [Chloroflexi bacterium HGW-Chloroflexi-5]